MKEAKVFAAWLNGTWTEVKAYKKENAVIRFQQQDSNIEAKDVFLTKSINSHQAPVEECNYGIVN